MTAAPFTLVAVVLMSLPQVSANVGVTVTVKLHEAVPHSLVAVHVTVVTPMGNADPDAGVQVTGVPAGVTVGAA